MVNKITVTTTWLQGCSGCHISLLDLHEDFLKLLELIEIKYSTIIDIKDVPEVDLAIVEGAVSNIENEHLLKEIRSKSKKLIALGSCACYGGIVGMRNLFTIKEVMQCAYRETSSSIPEDIPKDPRIPEMLPFVKPLHAVVPVDYFLPGCAPTPKSIKETLFAIIDGKEPVFKTRNLCEECKRKKTLMLDPHRGLLVEKLLSPMEIDYIDPEICFLEQGILCLGPATIEGCGALCPSANMPCRGCWGPAPHALEQGAKMINAMAALLPTRELLEKEDIVGTGYRFTMAVSIYPHISGLKKEGNR